MLPDIGDFDTVDIIEIAVKAGDPVAKEDTLITLESDKATMDIPSPYSGTVRDIAVKVGDKISEGGLIATIEETAGEAVAEPAQAPAPPAQDPQSKAPAAPPPVDTVIEAPVIEAPIAEPKPAPEAATPAVDTGSPKQVYAGPSVRRFARELGVELSLIKGSGRKGRILKEDVKAFTKSTLSGNKPAGGFTLPEMAPVDFAKFGTVETRPLGRIKRLGGQNLQRNWITIPSVTQFDEADITDLEEFRKSNIEAASQQGIKLTLLAFLVKAVVNALQQYPVFNSSLSADGENIIVKKYFHIGVAVNTDNGLMVPVIKDADKKGLFDIARQISVLSDQARRGNVAPKTLQGGCFTISSLGGIGGLHFTPIINAPEVAILGVSRAQIKPVYQQTGEFTPRLIMPFALSYDHRVIDGVAGARFGQFLSAVLTDVRRLLL